MHKPTPFIQTGSVSHRSHLDSLSGCGIAQQLSKVACKLYSLDLNRSLYRGGVLKYQCIYSSSVAILARSRQSKD